MLGAFEEIQLPRLSSDFVALPSVLTPPSAYSVSAPPTEPRALTGPSASGEAYYTRDLLTDPPTVVCIVPSLLQGGSCAGSRRTGGSATFAVAFADVEPTAGWVSDRNNASLDICFMHSFGKCSGKAKEKDPRTCHQIHVKREVLDRLRRTYVNSQRNYFCRTMKANITEKFAQVLSLLARRRFTLQYLEFKTDDIDVTSGSTAYEVQYRHWLVSDCASQKLEDRRGAGANTNNFISTSDLCWDFALTGRCSKGATCLDLHGHVAKALTKDRSVRLALEEMSKKEGSGGNGHPPSQPPLVTGNPQLPFANSQPQSFLSFPLQPPPPASSPNAPLQSQGRHPPPFSHHHNLQHQHQQQQHQSQASQQKRFGSGSPQIQMGRNTYQPSETKSLPFQLPPQSLPSSFMFPGIFPTNLTQEQQDHLRQQQQPHPGAVHVLSPPPPPPFVDQHQPPAPFVVIRPVYAFYCDERKH